MNSRKGWFTASILSGCLFIPFLIAGAQDQASRQNQSIPAAALTTKTVHAVGYEVGTGSTKIDLKMFGGNSNWRGPIWMPVNALLIRGLLNLYQFYGDEFKVESPTGSGKYMTLFEVGKELARRLSSIFLRDANGKRPVYGGTKKFQEDPH
jgi:hypothetical protein